MFTHQVFIDLDIAQAQVDERSDIRVLLLVEADRYLVDDSVAASLAYLTLDELRFVRPNVVLRKYFFDGLEPFFDRILIVSGTVLTDQIFEYVGRHVCAGFDILNEVLADHTSRKDVEGFLVDVSSGHGLLCTGVGKEMSVMHVHRNREFLV